MLNKNRNPVKFPPAGGFHGASKNKKLNLIAKLFLVIFLANFLFVPLNICAQEGADDLKQEIQNKQNQIDELQKKIDEYSQNIDYQKRQSLSLSNQVSILNNEISKLEAEVNLKQTQIEQTNLEISETEENIKNAEEDIAQQKEHLASFIREIYKQDKKSSIELILSTESFSDYYNYLHTLEILQDNTNQSLVELKDFKSNLEIHIASLEDKKETLETLIEELDGKKSTLASRSYLKQDLLAESRNSEVKFQSLVAELKAEQASINADIMALEKEIRQRLGQNALDFLGGSGDFIWPVPNRGITAYFHDPDYPFRYIFEHPAIDIKSAQGSPIKATASGYVAKVKISGTAYGYIMLINADGFSSVYGHTSKSFVIEDQYVSQGEVIGLSGGMPGTTGAGNLSTGPHLHFEVRKNGIPVNPLDYLP